MASRIKDEIKRTNKSHSEFHLFLQTQLLPKEAMDMLKPIITKYKNECNAMYKGDLPHWKKEKELSLF